MTYSNESARPSATVAAWLVRLLLAALLAFGNEVLLWINPPGRTLVEVALLAVGYAALATLLLDMAVRFRIYDLYGMMVLAGVYGLCAGLLLNPENAQVELPRTLLSRMLGAYTLLALEMMGLFLVLTGRQGRRARVLLLVGSAIVGLAWGVWVRWAGVLTDLGHGEVAPETMALYGGVGLALLGVLLAVVPGRTEHLRVADLQLSRRGMALLLLALLGLFVVRLLQNLVDMDFLATSLLLLGFCMIPLWFRRGYQGTTLMERQFPRTGSASPNEGSKAVLSRKRLSWLWVGLATAIFAGLAALGYQIPLVEALGENQLTVIVLGFQLYGAGWLPLVSLVLGVRGFGRLIQTDRI